MCGAGELLLISAVRQGYGCQRGWWPCCLGCMQQPLWEDRPVAACTYQHCTVAAVLLSRRGGAHAAPSGGDWQLLLRSMSVLDHSSPAVRPGCRLLGSCLPFPKCASAACITDCCMQLCGIDPGSHSNGSTPDWWPMPETLWRLCSAGDCGAAAVRPCSADPLPPRAGPRDQAGAGEPA